MTYCILLYTPYRCYSLDESDNLPTLISKADELQADQPIDGPDYHRYVVVNQNAECMYKAYDSKTARDRREQSRKKRG